MYKLEYLPAAKQAMIEIITYISKELKSPTVANRLAEELITAGNRIADFSYANPAYTPIRPLGHEYRKLLVHNDLMFYRVDEEKKLITVVRLIHARRDYETLLK